MMLVMVKKKDIRLWKDKLKKVKPISCTVSKPLRIKDNLKYVNIFIN